MQQARPALHMCWPRSKKYKKGIPLKATTTQHRTALREENQELTERLHHSLHVSIELYRMAEALRAENGQLRARLQERELE